MSSSDPTSAGHAPADALLGRPAGHRWAGLLLLLLGACGGDEPGPAVEDVLAREEVAAHFRLADYARAREALEPLLARERPATEDLLRRVDIELADSRPEVAQPFLERARQAEPERPGVLWASYRIAKGEGRFESALQALERLHALEPDDYPTRLALANMLVEVGREPEAEEHYRALLAQGDRFGEGWQLSATYRLFLLLQRAGRTDDALELQADLQRFEERGVARLGPGDIDRGTFGGVEPPAPGEVRGEAAWSAWMGDEPVDGRLEAPLALPLGGCVALEPVVLDDRWSWSEALWAGEWLPREAALREDPSEKSLTLQRVARLPTALFGWGPAGLVLARPGPSSGAAWTAETLHPGPVACAAALDLDLSDGTQPPGRDGRIDFVLAGERGVLVLAQGADGWEARGAPLLGPEFAVADLRPVDHDHDGDLDLLVVGPDGVRLLRNDGFGAEGGSFVDATLEAGLPRERGFRWCLAEDPDADNDVDLLLGGGGEVLYARNARGGRFEDVSATLSPALARALTREQAPLCADLDADGWTDLLLREGERVLFFAGGPDGTWRETDRLRGLRLPAGTPGLGTPFGEPRVELLWTDAGGSFTASTLGEGAPRVLASAVPADGALACVADVDGDGHEDLVEGAPGSYRLHPSAGEGHALMLSLQGVKDNRRGAGALVELRSGPLYRRIYWDGRPRSIGLGRRERVDLLRVTWPNGIVQEVVDLRSGGYVLRQREGLGGSCPFLYTWNGSTYEFVSDVLGITPLGLPMAPGELVPPDHDEFVLVRGDQLRERDGFLELQLTEELREVTYLDRVRLDVVDHPTGTEVFPNERFSFPPFPAAHTHTVRDPLAPLTAVDGEGRDWTAQLAGADGRYAVPFEPLFGQFLGLATPHELVLEFDPQALRGARKLRLLMTGWFYWTDASVNVAAARHPGLAFVPPLLSVPDGEGGWRGTGPPLGFPAGKLKTMVVDVSDLVSREDPRLRLFSTLQLYWDAIRLAVDDDDAELVVTPLEPASAELWSRGFSEPQAVMGVPGMDWFTWERLAPRPRWNQHPGLYTRYGETLPLVTAVDDRFVILGAGDALRVRFDAALAPPLRPGFVRDYLLFLDGWAKDRDPNTLEALAVEPLPFHGMSGYPYGPDEAFPDDAEHRAWRVEWNTRLSRRWLPVLAGRQPLSSLPSGPGRGAGAPARR